MTFQQHGVDEMRDDMKRKRESADSIGIGIGPVDLSCWANILFEAKCRASKSSD